MPQPIPYCISTHGADLGILVGGLLNVAVQTSAQMLNAFPGLASGMRKEGGKLAILRLPQRRSPAPMRSGACRLATVEREAAQEREQFRDLEERLLRTEQFADATLASEAKAQQQTTRLEEALAVQTLHLHDLCH